MSMKKETLVRKLSEKFFEDWQNTIASEVTEARSNIISVLKEKGTSLPGAVVALELVKAELIRGQLEEFLGRVKLSKKLPLATEARETANV